jgi:thymidylate synthase
MNNYINLLKKILKEGIPSDDRTGTGTLSLFSESLKFDLNDGFPLVTTKYTNFDAILAELLWFISGATNIKTLDSKIWNEWATEEGEIGPMYGYQWRNWRGFMPEDGSDHDIDQLAEVIRNIKNNPYSRRHVVSAWNVSELPEEEFSPQENVENFRMALAPCHHFFQFYVRNGELNLHFNMRSNDVFLGLPFNIASYAILLMIVADLTDLKPRILSYHGVDVHLYKNHIEQVKTQITREPKSLPTLYIHHRDNIDHYSKEDFILADYKHHPKLIGKISI